MRGKPRTRALLAALTMAVGLAGLAVPAYAADDVTGEGVPSVVADVQKNVSITVGGVTQGYDSILEALQATTDEPTRSIVLNGNVEESDGFEVRKGTSLTIDLNGHTASIYDSLNVRGDLTIKDSSNKSVDVVNPDGSVDSDSYEGGILSLEGAEESYAAIKVQNEGTLKLESGVIRSAYSGCVSVEGGKSFTMDGGFVAAHDGYAVEVNEGAKFTLNDGIVWTQNYTAISGDNAINRGNTSIEIYGGKVYSYNSDSSDVNHLIGVGVCEVMDGNSTLTINGGEIRSFNYGVAVIVNKGTCIINDGQLYGAGSNFEGQTAHGIQVNDGYALMLNKANAASTIRGGFFSADDGVPSLSIQESFAVLMSTDPETGTGVSIQGGTYTNPTGIDEYIDSGYYKLGHSDSERTSWVTVMEGISTPAVDEENVSITGRLPKKEHHVYRGQYKYYRTSIEGDSVTQNVRYSSRETDGSGTSNVIVNSVYTDYPTKDGYVFSGWWRNSDCSDTNVKPEESAESGCNYYAKMSDENLLTPIYQMSNSLYDDDKTNDDSATVYISSLIDSDDFLMWGLAYRTPTSLKTAFIWMTSAGASIRSVDPNTGAEVKHNATDFVLTATGIYGITYPVSIDNYGIKSQASSAWITYDGTRVTRPGTFPMSVFDYLEEMEKQGHTSDIELPSTAGKRDDI